MGTRADVAIAGIFLLGCLLFSLDGFLYASECAGYAEEDKSSCESIHPRERERQRERASERENAAVRPVQSLTAGMPQVPCTVRSI